MNFLEKFPDEFILECAMTMSASDFEYFFKDEVANRIIGYVRVAKGFEHITSINYNGIKYCAVAEEVDGCEIDKRFQVYFDDDNIICSYVYDKDIEYLKSGLYTVVPDNNRYVRLREEK